MPKIYSNDEYKDILQIYIESEFNSRKSERMYRERYPLRRAPHFKVFQDTYQRFSETGSSNMKIILAREINNNHTEQVMNMVTNDPTISTRRIAARTGIPRSTVHRKLKREGFNPFYSFCFA